MCSEKKKILISWFALKSSGTCLMFSFPVFTCHLVSVVSSPVFPRNIFNRCCCIHLLLSLIPLVRLLSSRKVDGEEMGDVVGVLGTEEPHSKPPFHLSTSGSQARRLKSQLRDAEQKQRNLNVKSYRFFSRWAHLFTNGYFSTYDYMRLLFFSQQWWQIRINDKRSQGLFTQAAFVWKCFLKKNSR